MNEQPEWQVPLTTCVADNGQQGGFLILMPEYRPDIALSMGHYLNLEFLDYRKEEMMPLGWDADGITLQSLNETIQSHSAGKGVVVFNVEALLATKREAQRQQWINEFLQTSWPNPVLIPLVIYCDEVPQWSQRICDMQNMTFPDQGLVSRLAM